MSNIFKIYVLCFFFFAFNPESLSQEIYTPHCPFGCPDGVPETNDLIVREIYTLSSNDQTKFADWVAYKITADTIGSTRNRNWKPDPLLDENETLEPEDYKGANAALKTDRGHQVPLTAFTGTAHWKDTNYLSNITPQKSALNQGPWEKLEAAEKNLIRVNSYTAVFVQTGPLYERVMSPLPNADEEHKVPSGYWKVILGVKNKESFLTGFIFDQETKRSEKFCDKQVPLETIQELTSLELFFENSEPVLGTTSLQLKIPEFGCE